jgi:type IV pilus assembly protein PilM
MSFLDTLTSLVKEPPPSYVFELSEAGIAYAKDGDMGFEALPEGTLSVSPLENNLLRADVASAAIARIAPPNGSRKPKPVALILPDYCARVSVLDFDSFPSSEEEQAQLVRFRVKKTVPFDIDSAAVSYHVQPVSGSKKVEVVAVTVSLEILARYEALFRSANLHPGEVTTSTIAALNLHRDPGTTVIAKLAGKVLSVAVTSQGRLKLFRCLALEGGTNEEILAVLHPTFAYVEDELGEKVNKVVLCGFSNPPEGLDLPTEVLRSSRTTPGGYNAGLLGYLEASN